jgi:hypothetical protein
LKKPKEKNMIDWFTLAITFVASLAGTLVVALLFHLASTRRISWEYAIGFPVGVTLGQAITQQWAIMGIGAALITGFTTALCVLIAQKVAQARRPAR